MSGKQYAGLERLRADLRRLLEVEPRRACGLVVSPPKKCSFRLLIFNARPP